MLVVAVAEKIVTVLVEMVAVALEAQVLLVFLVLHIQAVAAAVAALWEVTLVARVVQGLSLSHT
jgi:hypothetical protein